jgi:biotin operon repressor
MDDPHGNQDPYPAQVDTYSIADLQDLYGINRSTVYARISGLEAKGYDFTRQSLNGRSVFTADQKQLLDVLDQHIQKGMAIATFPSPDGSALPVLPDSRQLSHQTISPDTRQLSRQTGQVDALMVLAERIARFTPSSNPLANLEALERAAEKGWHLSSSQLAPLLGRKSLTGNQIDRYGFRCTRSGRNGNQSAWKIEKVSHS